MIELRELKTSDMFTMITILNKIGVKEIKNLITPDNVQSLTKKKDDNQDLTTVLGFNLIMEVAGLILGNLPACEQDVYRFVSGLSGLKVQEIADLPPAEFADIVIRIIRKPEFMDFFKVVSKSLLS